MARVRVQPLRRLRVEGAQRHAVAQHCRGGAAGQRAVQAAEIAVAVTVAACVAVAVIIGQAIEWARCRCWLACSAASAARGARARPMIGCCTATPSRTRPSRGSPRSQQQGAALGRVQDARRTARGHVIDAEGGAVGVVGKRVVRVGDECAAPVRDAEAPARDGLRLPLLLRARQRLRRGSSSGCDGGCCLACEAAAGAGAADNGGAAATDRAAGLLPLHGSRKAAQL